MLNEYISNYMLPPLVTAFCSFNDESEITNDLKNDISFSRCCGPSEEIDGPRLHYQPHSGCQKVRFPLH